MRIFLPAMLLLTFAASTDAAKIADITRIGGQRTNVLTGIGLVTGLKGTGDGGDFMPAIRPLAAMLSHFNNAVIPVDLKSAQNVAIVNLIAVVPSNGVRNGDHLDVRVMSFGAAASLKGGYLFVCPMQGPMPEPKDRPRLPLALSDGPIVIEDTSTPTVGVVKGGCVMEEDLPARAIDDGKFSLIIEEPSASWAVASTISKMINDSWGDGTEQIATALDAKNVMVNIPQPERARPDAFIASIQRLQLPPLVTEARVAINEKTGSIILTGDVEISPVVISHKGLTISTIEPKPVPSPRTPVATQKDVVALDTTQQGGARLQDLALAFDQLKVPPEDRIAIVKELHRLGKLHAKLLLNGQER